MQTTPPQESFLHRLLENPLFYELKTQLFSLGRHSVSRYLQHITAQNPAGTILDVACGCGRHTAFPQGRAFGIDLNPRYIAYAKQRTPARFAVMSALNMAFPSACFDLTFCVGLLHHLPDAAARNTVQEMQRVTRTQGRIIVIEAVIPSFPNLPGQLLCKADRGANIRTVSRLQALLAPEGFQLDTPSLPGSFPYQRAAFIAHS